MTLTPMGHSPCWIPTRPLYECLIFRNHTLSGMDYMAIYCLWWGDVLIHPDIQAYYVKEGKQIDYLADRLPEYEQYRK